MARSGYRLKNRVRLVFFSVLLFTLVAAGGMYAWGYVHGILYDLEIVDTPPEADDAFEGKINVLALGVDNRKGEKMARADTIMLCSIDTEKNLMSVLSIPRDTRVQIPGRGWEKINSATLYGGPELAMRTVSDLLDIKVNKYVLTNFEGFKDIVDSLGGVTIDVKQRMYHYDPEDRGIYTIDLRPGVQRMNGEKALQYVRYRGYALGDIDRTEQQRSFITALVKEAMQPSTVVKLPSLAISINKAVDTNLSLSEMTRLAKTASKMTNANIISQTLPGEFLNLDDGSYWEVDPQRAKLVIAGIMEGKTSDKVVLGQKTVTTGKVPGGVEAGGGIIPTDAETGNEPVNSTKKNSETPRTAANNVNKPADKKQPVSNTGNTNTVKTGSQSGTSAGTSTGTSKVTKVTTAPPSGAIVPGVPQSQQSSQQESKVYVSIEPKSN